MEDLDFVDISEVKPNDIEEIKKSNDDYIKKESPEKDKFIIGVYISLAVLIIFTIVIYFFGYELFKPMIKV